MQDPATQKGYDRVDLVLRALSTGAAVVDTGATIYSAGRKISTIFDFFFSFPSLYMCLSSKGIKVVMKHSFWPFDFSNFLLFL